MTRILQAGFPTIKTFDPFDFSFPRAINKTQILNLLDLTFVNQENNVILAKQEARENKRGVWEQNNRR